jgi:uncharacterized membrane protein YhaH (DUF805 family)
MHLVILYILAAALVGYAGRSRRIGFLGFFLVSLIITPVLGFVIVFLSAPSRARTETP